MYKNNLMVYQKIGKAEILAHLQTDYVQGLSGLLEVATTYGFVGDLWHCYLTFLLVCDENPYSLSCEGKHVVADSLYEIANADFAVIKGMFEYDFTELEKKFQTTGMEALRNYHVESPKGILNQTMRGQLCALSKALGEAKSVYKFQKIISEHYRLFGVGKFGMHKAFRVVQSSRQQVEILPITNIAKVRLDDLVGYQSAKQKLIHNTLAFLQGKPANNCLLYGDAGTGKSSSIKGILNQYFSQGLRIIELYKHQFQDLNHVIAQIKNRNYKFIIYMDDLSFEEFETEYKYLKAVIEGGLEKKPDNVLIYATSNRRHLIRETFRDKEDRDEELHKNDTVQEKHSLFHRFGVSIYFGAPGKKEFDEIVCALANRHGIDLPQEELLLQASRWEMSHGGRSGRTARQFIDYYLGTHFEMTLK
ncbi:MAG: ATP-binding protein [Lachnospiraceae bacterium]|nr:ATP-binding protein [Lachnospiraceae bacterium]